MSRTGDDRRLAGESRVHPARAIRIRLMDLNCLVYLALVGLAIVIFRQRVPGWTQQAAMHGLFVGAILALLWCDSRHSGVILLRLLRTLYPLGCIAFAWGEMTLLVPMVWGDYRATDLLISIDRSLFGVAPTVWVQRLYGPVLDDVMHAFYSGYYLFMPLVIGVFLARRRLGQLRSVLGMVTFAYLANDLLYFVCPALGPRMVPELVDAQTVEAGGRWFGWITRAAQSQGGIVGGCFPSSHVTGAFAWCLAAGRYDRRLGRVLASFLPGITVSTVYLRYHHACDALAGIALGPVALSFAVWLMRRRREESVAAYEFETCRAAAQDDPRVSAVCFFPPRDFALGAASFPWDSDCGILRTFGFHRVADSLLDRDAPKGPQGAGRLAADSRSARFRPGSGSRHAHERSPPAEPRLRPRISYLPPDLKPNTDKEAAMSTRFLFPLIAVAMLTSVTGFLGCGDESPVLGPTELSSVTNPKGVAQPAPPEGCLSVECLGQEMELWPYTGPLLDGTPLDPVNLIFVGQASPLQIRAALMALDGDRTAFGFPDEYPFNLTWSDAIGDLQATWAGMEGWTGSVVQLQLGDYDPIRWHLRLFDSGQGFEDGGVWTVGAAHFEIRIPGTADHQPLSWEVAEQMVMVDLLRTGLLDPDTPYMPSGPINASPSWREIIPEIYNELPEGLRQYIGGPLEDVTEPVPILTDGSATMLHLAGALPIIPGAVVQTHSFEYEMMMPKPFCDSGGDWVVLTGPVNFQQEVMVNPNGNYQVHSSYSGVLTVIPWDPQNMQPLGDPYPAEVQEHHEGFIHGSEWRAGAFLKQEGIQESGTEMFMTTLRLASQGSKASTVKTSCLGG